MNTNQSVQQDERTAAVLYAGTTWGYNFITFALLIDIMYRNVVFHEAPWDLFALIGLSGAISIVYAARHKALGQVFGWKSAIVFAVVAIVAAVVAAILAMTKAM
jgi:hypothetical protein